MQFVNRCTSMYIPGTPYKITWYRVFFTLYVITYLFFWLHKSTIRQHRLAPIALTPYQAEHISKIQTGGITPQQLVGFACSMAGTPYKYGSTDPNEGLDCSGFVTYVFNHFGISVPRVSADFTAIQHEVPVKDAKMGDLILFTGTDSTERVVGHMGIISSMPGEPLRFIHSTSGKGYGVTETDFNNYYYESRFVKVVRIFPQNEEKQLSQLAQR